MEFIHVGDTVKANRDIPAKKVKAGDQGTVLGVNCLDSEDYLDIQLSEDHIVYCSSENCWNKVGW